MMTTDNLQEFVVNPWKVELVGTFFQSGIKKRETDRMPPLVFEDCNVSTICVASEIDTTNDEDGGKDVGSSWFVRENRLEERDKDKTDLQVGKLMFIEVKSQNDNPSVPGIVKSGASSVKLSTETDLVSVLVTSSVTASSATTVSSDRPVSLAKPVYSASPISPASPTISSSNPVASPRPVSSAKPMASARPVTSARTISSASPISSSKPVASPRPVSSAKPITSVRPVTSPKPVSPTDLDSISTASMPEVTACSQSLNIPLSSTVEVVPTSTKVSIDKEVLSDIASLACTSTAQAHGSQVVSMLSPVSSTRPTLIKKPSPKKSSLHPPPRSVPPVTTPDQGSTCVSVILKSSRMDPKAARLNTVAKRQRQVEQLVSNYRLRFSHKSSPGVQVRLDYCFNQPEDARQFYKSVTSLVQSQPPPRLLSCMLMAEADLGYQHKPVLTEHDLLAIQSPEYCRNLFRTSILIKVVQEKDVVVYHFKSVTDVNRFLYNKSSSMHTRSLGLLRRNVVPKRICPDDEGNFRLFTAETNVSERLCRKHKFSIQQVQRKENDSLPDGNYLLFSSKLDLFKFLVSDDAADIEHLQFDGKKIKSFGKAVNEDSQVKMVKEKEASLLDKLEQHNERKEYNSTETLACSRKSDQELFELDVARKTIQLSKKKKNLDCPSVQQDIKLIKSVHFDKDNLEMNRISVFDNVQNFKEAEPRKDGEVKVDLIKADLSMKDEEIRSLKKKLLLKEKIIQAEILEKTSAKSSLKEALSQLDKINQLSLSVIQAE